MRMPKKSQKRAAGEKAPRRKKGDPPAPKLIDRVSYRTLADQIAIDGGLAGPETALLLEAQHRIGEMAASGADNPFAARRILESWMNFFYLLHDQSTPENAARTREEKVRLLTIAVEKYMRHQKEIGMDFADETSVHPKGIPNVRYSATEKGAP